MRRRAASALMVGSVTSRSGLGKVLAGLAVVRLDAIVVTPGCRLSDVQAASPSPWPSGASARLPDSLSDVERPFHAAVSGLGWCHRPPLCWIEPTIAGGWHQSTSLVFRLVVR